MCFTALSSPEPKKFEIKPGFLGEMRDVNTFEGKDVKLSVQVTGKPRPKVEWLKDSKPVSKYDRRMKMDEDFIGGYTLTIRDTVQHDSGEYACVATNSAGKATCSARVVVESTFHCN